MVQSIWRKSHFWLAIISSLFLVILAITGIFLSIEASNRTNNELNISHYPNTHLSKILELQKDKEFEIISIEKSEYGFLETEYLTFDGDMLSGIIHPKTGEIHPPKEKAPLFDFLRSFHRSLFLGKIGRLIVGIVAFLLILISISGVALIAKRQLTFKRFFGKIHFDNWFTFGHVLSGRWGLLIILTIAVSGAYLSMKRFEIIGKTVVKEHNTESLIFDEPEQISWSDFEVFEQTALSDFEELSFPFSPFPEDYFTLKTETKSQIINQFDGKILDSIDKEPTHSFLKNVHTGANYFWWNFILIIGAISILFFIFTGFKIHFSRGKRSFSNAFPKNEAEILIYFGSETNSTANFAQFLSKELQKNGKSVFVDKLNNYTQLSEKNQTILLLTSTYGNGESPQNANQFLEKFEKYSPKKQFDYAVLGFGSKDYPLFCNFAQTIEEKVGASSNSKQLIEYSTVNNQSEEEINSWLKQLSEKLNVNIDEFSRKEPKLEKFRIIGHSKETHPDLDNFWLKIGTKKPFESGDLLSVVPSKGERQRYYSVAKWNDELLIGIRKHELGLCSNYLFELGKNAIINGWIQKNQSFHCPKEDVLFIANGTGAIPFLGMIKEKDSQSNHTLFWGLKNKQNFDLYSDKIEELMATKKLNRFEKIFSQEENGGRVQNLVQQNEAFVKSHLQNGGTLMICGASAMEKDIRFWIDSLGLSLSDSQILADTY